MMATRPRRPSPLWRIGQVGMLFGALLIVWGVGSGLLHHDRAHGRHVATLITCGVLLLMFAFALDQALGLVFGAKQVLTKELERS